MAGNIKWVTTTEIAISPQHGLESALKSAQNAVGDLTAPGTLTMGRRLAETAVPYPYNDTGKAMYDEDKANAFIAGLEAQWAMICKPNVVQWANLGIVQYAEYAMMLEDTGLHGNGVYCVRPKNGVGDVSMQQFTDKANAVKQAVAYTQKTHTESVVWFSNGKTTAWYPVAFANIRLVRTSAQVMKPKSSKNWVKPMSVYVYFGYFSM